mmetsp:Transcript_134191/g.428787  ORF Transcript_134191/g.428787 Transcript_134191/m.428787 type:complete len:836 (+) Transcript_134191:1-2508(+)
MLGGMGEEQIYKVRLMDETEAEREREAAQSRPTPAPLHSNDATEDEEEAEEEDSVGEAKDEEAQERSAEEETAEENDVAEEKARPDPRECVRDHGPDRGIEEIETADSSGTCLKGEEAEDQSDDEEDEDDDDDEVESSYGSVPSMPERSAADSDAGSASGEPRPRPAGGAGPFAARKGFGGSLSGLVAFKRTDGEAITRDMLLMYRQVHGDLPRPTEMGNIGAEDASEHDGVGATPSTRGTPSGRDRPRRDDGDIRGQRYNRNQPKVGRQNSRGYRDDFEREPVVPLEVSSSSWSAQQKNFKEERQTAETTTTDDALDNQTITRRIRSILNKITLEKFGKLSGELMECGISTQGHLEILMHEIMEKATTQHHFIKMYTDLCKLLNEWTTENGIGDSAKGAFKRILLNECQNSFERHLKPPENLKELTGEDLVEAEVKYKTAMIGNIRFVGCLLAEQMVASQVTISVTTELITIATQDALESLAAFLTTIGPILDRQDWKHINALNDVFNQIRKMSNAKDTPPRIRCLLSDVLDLRNAGWQDHKMATKSSAGPMTLEEVHSKALADERLSGKGGGRGSTPSGSRPAWGGSGSAPGTPAGRTMGRQSSGSQDGWSTVGGPARSTNVVVPSRSSREGASGGGGGGGSSSRMTTPVGGSSGRPSAREQTTPSGDRSSRATPSSGGRGWGAEARAAPEPAATADPAKIRQGFSNTVKELAFSHNSDDAVHRMREMKVPEQYQAQEFSHMLADIAEQGNSGSRGVCFRFAVRLFNEGVLSKSELVPALDRFFDQTYEELCFDVTSLPKIMLEECLPAFQDLVKDCALTADQHQAYVNRIKK